MSEKIQEGLLEGSDIVVLEKGKSRQELITLINSIPGLTEEEKVFYKQFVDENNEFEARIGGIVKLKNGKIVPWLETIFPGMEHFIEWVDRQEKILDSLPEGAIYLMMHVVPEGVTFSPTIKTTAAAKRLIKKGLIGCVAVVVFEDGQFLKKSAVRLFNILFPGWVLGKALKLAIYKDLMTGANLFSEYTPPKKQQPKES
jgi:hypothetical protein